VAPDRKREAVNEGLVLPESGSIESALKAKFRDDKRRR
jgi:hypothetical protein